MEDGGETRGRFQVGNYPPYPPLPLVAGLPTVPCLRIRWAEHRWARRRSGGQWRAMVGNGLGQWRYRSAAAVGAPTGPGPKPNKPPSRPVGLPWVLGNRCWRLRLRHPAHSLSGVPGPPLWSMPWINCPRSAGPPHCCVAGVPEAWRPLAALSIEAAAAHPVAGVGAGASTCTSFAPWLAASPRGQLHRNSAPHLDVD